MKTKNKIESDSAGQPTPQFAQSRGTKTLNLIGAALSDLYGRHFTYEELAHIAGQSTTTIFDWMLGANLRQMESLIRLLEYLPKSNRVELLDRIFRELPTIHHERISWSERQISNCQQLLRLETGLSLVMGEENVRDFVITALGHSANRLNSPRTTVFGLDTRLPDRFVPVNGISYLGVGLHPEKLKAASQAVWPAIRSAKTGLIFLNGVGPVIHDKQDEVRDLCKRRLKSAAGVTWVTGRFKSAASSLTMKHVSQYGRLERDTETGVGRRSKPAADSAGDEVALADVEEDSGTQ